MNYREAKKKLGKIWVAFVQWKVVVVACTIMKLWFSSKAMETSQIDAATRCCGISLQALDDIKIVSNNKVHDELWKTALLPRKFTIFPRD